MSAFDKFSVVINASETSQMRSIYPIYLFIIDVFTYFRTYLMKLSCIWDYTALNGRLVSELSIENNVTVSIHDLIWQTVLECAWRDREKSWKSLEISVGFWVSRWDFPNAYYGCWQLELNLGSSVLWLHHSTTNRTCYTHLCCRPCNTLISWYRNT
jgi:hypothetical protein